MLDNEKPLMQYPYAHRTGPKRVDDISGLDPALKSAVLKKAKQKDLAWQLLRLYENLQLPEDGCAQLCPGWSRFNQQTMMGQDNLPHNTYE